MYRTLPVVALALILFCTAETNNPFDRAGGNWHPPV